MESFDHIKNLKNKCDYVIVIYHGGKEHYRFPSPNLQKTSRKMVEKGADLILCQHSHCIGSCEKYNGSTILYGQGNFIFNKKDNEYWNTGLLVKVDLKEKNKVNFIPYEVKGSGIRILKGSKKENIMGKFKKRSEKILDLSFVKKKYDEYSLSKLGNYLRVFFGLGKWLSRFDRIILNGWLVKRFFNKNKLIKILNYIDCEAHRELIINGLKEYIKEK